MSNRKIYTVTFDKESKKWKGQAVDSRPSATGTKEEVSDRMQEIAKNHGHSQLRIYKKGKPGYEERTYGDDPFPPRG